jgi:hypothetical protein
MCIYIYHIYWRNQLNFNINVFIYVYIYIHRYVFLSICNQTYIHITIYTVWIYGRWRCWFDLNGEFLESNVKGAYIYIDEFIYISIYVLYIFLDARCMVYEHHIFNMYVRISINTSIYMRHIGARVVLVGSLYTYTYICI